MPPTDVNSLVAAQVRDLNRLTRISQAVVTVLVLALVSAFISMDVWGILLFMSALLLAPYGFYFIRIEFRAYRAYDIMRRHGLD